MYRLARSLLFLLNPETAHDVTMTVMSAGGRTGLVSKISQPVPDAPVRVMGLEFPNPVGLAAGLDKDGECIQAFDQLGFGFVEVGTVTPVGQPGRRLASPSRGGDPPCAPREAVERAPARSPPRSRRGRARRPGRRRR